MSSTVEDWLRSLGLIQYTQAFLDNGYDELDICKEIGEDDLDAIGVKNMKDRVDILSAVNRLRQSGTAVYFVLEEGTQPTPPTQSREKIIPLKLKMFIRDTLEEDNVKLSELPYTLSNGLRGNLENLVTLYADKFYTYEEDVFEALESLRVRQVGEMQAQLRNNLTVNDAPSSNNEEHITTLSKHQHKRSHTTPLHSDTKEPSGWHTAPSSLTTKNVDPADYLDVDTQSSPRHKNHKRRRPVQRNSKLSRSLDSLKELHVNEDLKTKADKDTSTSKHKQSSLFGIFRNSKRKNASVTEDKTHDTKNSSNSVVGVEYPASCITMGEEDRVTLMLMVKNGELTVEEAVQQMESYEKEHKKTQISKKNVTRTSSSCSEEESPKSHQKLKRGIFGRSTKKKSVSRPGSEIAACDMTMSEEDRINLMKSVRDHEITVEDALHKLLSFEEDSHVPKGKSTKPKFSPKSPHSFSRLSIKRVSGAFSSTVKSGPAKDEPTAVFYIPPEGSVNTSSEEDSTHLPSDSSPDPSPAGHRKTGHELLRNTKHNQIHSTSSLHSSSSSSDAVDRLGTIEVTDTHGGPTKRGVAIHPEKQILNEMKYVFTKRGTADNEEENPPSGQTSTLPRNGRPKNPSLSRKGSLPLSPTHKPPPPIPHPVRKAPLPPPRTLPRQATAPALRTQGTEHDIESSVPKAPSKWPPVLPSRRKSCEESSMNDVKEKLPLPPPREQTVDNSEQLKDSPSQTVNNSVNSNRDSLDDDVFPPPPLEVLLTGEPEVHPKNIIIKPPRPSLKKTERVLAKDNEDTCITAPRTHDKEPPTVPQSIPGVPPVTKPKPVVKKKPKIPPKPPAKPGSCLREDLDEKGATVARDEASLLIVPDLPVPKKRPSHSLSDLIERRLRIEQIDLTDAPYTSTAGRWGVPINLIDRYTEELRRSQKEIVDIMDRIRCTKLKENGRFSIPCDLSLYPQEPDHLGQAGSLEEWLVSLGLPMYIDNLKEVEYDDMNVMPHLKQKHFEYAGVVDLRHMRRLLASVERMPR